MRTIIGIDEELISEATMPRAMRQRSNGWKQRWRRGFDCRSPSRRNSVPCMRGTAGWNRSAPGHHASRHMILVDTSECTDCMGRRFSPLSQQPDKPGRDQIVPGRRVPADFVQRTRERRQPRFVEAAVARLRMAVLRGEYIAGLAAPDER